MFDKETYVKKLIGFYLEDSPTLVGLPLEFLPVDIISTDNNGYYRLDFTSSPDYEAIINKIYKDIDKNELDKLFNESKKDFSKELFDIIQYTYHKRFYNNIHLNSKKACSKFLSNVLSNILRDFKNDDRDDFLNQYKLKDSFYKRGLLDYDYNLLGLKVSDDNFRRKLKESLIKVRDSYIRENSILKDELKNEGIKVTSEKDSIKKVVAKDLENINYILDRVIKIVKKNFNFYRREIEQEYWFSIKVNKLGDCPVIGYKSMVSDKTYIYFTPFSSYIKIEGDDTVYTLYHIGRDTLKDCEIKTVKAIQKFNFPINCLEHPKVLNLR